MKKKKKSRGKAARRPPPPIRFGRNPGIESLMVVNPGRRPSAAQTDLFRSHPTPAPRPAKAKRPKKGKRPPMRPVLPPRSLARPAPGPNVTVAVAPAAAPRIDYRAMLGRPHKSKAKNPNRGVKTLTRERRSVLWNARVGAPGAREYLRKHFPHVNPEPGPLLALGMGGGTFLASRVVSNLATKIPGVSRLGMHAPVITSGLLAGLAWFLTRKRPQYRSSVLTGAGLALLDSVLRHYLPAIFPAAAGVLGNCDGPRRLSAYDDLMGYLPVDGGDGSAEIAAREAMAQDGNALVTREAMAGFSGYVPEGMSDYPHLQRAPQWWHQQNIPPMARVQTPHGFTIAPPPPGVSHITIAPPPPALARIQPGSVVAPPPPAIGPTHAIPPVARLAGGIFGSGD